MEMNPRAPITKRQWQYIVALVFVIGVFGGLIGRRFEDPTVVYFVAVVLGIMGAWLIRSTIR